MSGHRGPVVPLVNTNDEKSAAAQTNQVEHGTETRPIIQTDSLATSSIIYSALNSAAVGGGGGPVINGMKLVAQRLSQNSLAPWYKVRLSYILASTTHVFLFRERSCSWARPRRSRRSTDKSSVRPTVRWSITPTLGTRVLCCLG